ncbi:MAG TPA: stalk domain-containing protein, partial [Syntrophomonas sp.]|nr:stalk domain-containing protein [Syntrophomonas sp.]
GITVVLAMGMFLVLFAFAGQAEASVIEKAGTPVQMVLTDWGGVSLNLDGQEKYFKVWERSTGAYNKINLPLTNIDSYDVDGRNLLYTISSGSAMDVYLYNLDTGASTVISKSATAKRNVKICGNRIAWVDYGIGDGGIYIQNLTDGSSISIKLQESTNIELALTSDYLAYLGHQNGVNGVFVYSFKDGSTANVHQAYSDKASLTMSGTRLVWAEGSGANLPTGSFYNQVYGYAVAKNALNEIWMYDIATAKETQLTDNDTNDVQPCIWGDYVVWAQNAKGTPDIMLMNLASGTTEKIAATDYYEAKPNMDYGYLAYITINGTLADLTVQPLPGSPAPPAAGNGTPIAGALAPVTVYINDSEYHMTPEPYIKDGRTMVPMRRIFEILGASVTWNEAERSVTAVKGSSEIKLYIGSTTAYKNGQTVQLDVPPEIMAAAGSTMVPLRFVSEALNCSVDWTSATRTVTINTGI